MRTLDRAKLGDLIAKLRRSKDLSLDGMGELLHVSGRTVRRWEKGEILPTMEDVVNISNEFNISLEEIYNGEINIDREVNRKLSQMGSNIESIGQKITSAEEAVKNISDGVIEIKDQITRSTDIKGENWENLTWMKLLITHLVCTGASFLCYVMWRLRLEIAFLFAVFYVGYLTWLIIKEKNNYKSQKLFFLYSIILLLNFLVNYVLFADITPGVINNIELMLVNGAMYGFRLIGLYNMILQLIECILVYCFWIVYTGYNLIRKK